VIQKLINPLYIAPTNQRTRDLKPQIAIIHPFATVMSLDEIINDIFERNHLGARFEIALAGSLVYQIIKDKKIDYFYYVSLGSNATDLIYDFILKCHRNDIDFEDLLEGEKLEAIQRIDTAYQAFKMSHDLVDSADIEHFVYALMQQECSYFSNYSDVYIDTFSTDTIDFYASKIQEKIVSFLKSKYQSLPAKAIVPKAILYVPSKAPFNAMDEVRTALKIARKLLLGGDKAEDIILVTTDIAEYAPLFRLLLDEYVLQGFDSLGTPLALYESKVSTASAEVHQVNAAFNDALNNLQKKAIQYDLKVDTDLLRTQLLSQHYIRTQKVGLELTEANQLLGLDKSYKHIVFMGTDINHFPPKSSDNFLYSTKEAIKYFATKSYYDSSLAQYETLKALGENLYILTASYSGKRTLARSIVIQDTITQTINIDDMMSPHELYLTGSIANTDATLQSYFDSITSDQFTAFDGVGVEGVQAKHLSASQLNTYATCPLKYIYLNKLKIKAPTQEESGFEVTDKGTLMHGCFENFAKRVQGDTDISLEKLCAVMVEVLDQEFEKVFVYHEKKNPEPPSKNVHHEIFKTELSLGLRGGVTLGLLVKFINYYVENAQDLAYFARSVFEQEFALDSNLKPYTLVDEEDTNYFIKGYIDRLDLLTDKVNIIDYKSKKASTIDQKKLQAIEEFKDFQLGLYMLYTTQTNTQEEQNAALLTFKSDKPFIEFAKISTMEENIPEVRKKPTGLLYDATYCTSLQKEIMTIKTRIEAGEFSFDNSDEEVCGYCEIRHLCHQNVLSKGANNESK
jgi:hypothetical protein